MAARSHSPSTRSPNTACCTASTNWASCSPSSRPSPPTKPPTPPACGRRLEKETPMRAVITTLPGDGIGPEVVAEGVRVLRAVADRWGHELQVQEALLGGCAIDATGTALPDATLAACRESDAVLLGAVGGPQWDNPEAKVRPEQGLLGLRKALGLFANLRPVTVYPQLIAASPLRPERLAGVDLLVVRELTGGIY